MATLAQRWRGIAFPVVMFSVCFAAMAQEASRVEGRITKDGKGFAAVVVLIHELKLTDVTDEDGRFHFDNVAPGNYNLVMTLGENVATRAIVVTAGQTTTVEQVVDWEAGGFEEVTVTAVEMAAKIVDAPAAITSIPVEQIEQQASHGQVPKILEFTPGAELTQSGLYDFNFNTRGFNSSLNRRVSTYIDGRDVGVVLLGAQEWSAIGGLDDIASLEFIRGPSAALYGANASSGVINITTKPPRSSIGDLLRVTTGELATRYVEYRRAAELGHDWYYKVILGYKDSGDFTVSRNPDVNGPYPESPYPDFGIGYCLLVGEKECLLEERSLPREQDDEIGFGTVRFDKYLHDDSTLTFEAGISQIKGPVFQTGIGRVQNLDSERPYFRFAYAHPHWNVIAHYTRRDGHQINLTKALVTNYDLWTQDERIGIEGQGHWNFFNDEMRFVIGAAYTAEDVDTADPQTGLQTVVYQPITSNRQAVFSQIDLQMTEKLKFVGAGRFDFSTLHDTQFSPKGAFVYSLNSANSFRLTYNRAFQVANYSEFFLHTNISHFPIGGFVRTICEGPILPKPVDCGIEGDFIPILAVGNDDLDLETTEAWELGYSGVIASKAFLTVDYYKSKNKNFITDLVPQVGTILGNLEGCKDQDGNQITDPKECPINNDYAPWVGPEECETTILFGNLTVCQALRNAVDNSVGGNTLGFRLAQDLNGDDVVVGRTYTNVGLVHTQGVDVGLQYFIRPYLNLQFSYSWFDFKIVEPKGDIEAIRAILLPNTPPHKASMGISVTRDRWSFSAAGRWVKGFQWSAGVFDGPVPAYTTVDLSGSWRFNKHFEVGANIANAFDREHWESFGGDVLERRALVHLTSTW